VINALLIFTFLSGYLYLIQLKAPLKKLASAGYHYSKNHYLNGALSLMLTFFIGFIHFYYLNL